MRARPALLKENGFEVVRWSRPSIGLTRTDLFDYAAWLRDEKDLGVADVCVVQLGANDRQSIVAGPRKWILFPTEAWQQAYAERVQAMVESLRTQHCRRLIWVLQPAFERRKILASSSEMINVRQAAGVADAGLVMELSAAETDYGADGIHFNGPFTL